MLHTCMHLTHMYIVPPHLTNRTLQHLLYKLVVDIGNNLIYTLATTPYKIYMYIRTCTYKHTHVTVYMYVAIFVKAREIATSFKIELINS